MLPPRSMAQRNRAKWRNNYIDTVLRDRVCLLAQGVADKSIGADTHLRIGTHKLAELIDSERTRKGDIFKSDLSWVRILRKSRLQVTPQRVEICGGKKEDVGLDELGEGGKGVISKIGEFGREEAVMVEDFDFVSKVQEFPFCVFLSSHEEIC
ncbi:hypothetical protein Tco_1083030 [Tanacetum coccineum]|uniref:Uncharacterized protein n=1 Tax=Tanacetum coccineum TaxID=301880 RepID=A0ABQ5I3J2_9ASTR